MLAVLLLVGGVYLLLADVPPVALTWETASEVGAAGFNVYRADVSGTDARDGDFVLVDRAFWPAPLGLVLFAFNGLPATVAAFAGTLRADGSLRTFGVATGALSLAYWLVVAALCLLVREGWSLLAVMAIVMALSGAVGVVLFASIIGA